jgi:hypothetical protein
MACQVELGALEACVSADAAACACGTIAPVDPIFIDAGQAAFATTMAFDDPSTPEFCTKANSLMCDFLETTNCCCAEEQKTFTDCQWINKWTPSFSVAPGCNFGGCVPVAAGGGGAALEEEGGGSMMIIVVIVILLLGGVGGGYYYYRRRNGGFGKKSISMVRSKHAILDTTDALKQRIKLTRLFLSTFWV